MDFDKSAVGVEVELERRLALLENGYAPLPLTPPPDAKMKGELLGSKAVTLKGWPTIDLTAQDATERIRRWRMHSGFFQGVGLRSQTTGIRFPTAIDLDIDDQAAAEAVLSALADTFGDEWFDRSPVRTGSGHKLCVITGSGKDTPRGKTLGPHWMSYDREAVGRVELFHGQGQIGVSGVHSYRVVPQEGGGFFTPAPQFEPEILYSYLEGPTPFDTPVADLPQLPAASLQRVIPIVDEVLEGAGWVKLDTEGVGGGSATSYTLPTDQTFDTVVGELRYEDLYEGLRVAMHTITGEGSNPARGWVFETRRNGQDWIGVHDHESSTNYLPSGARPLTSQERVARMNERLRGRFSPPPAASVGATRRRTQRN